MALRFAVSQRQRCIDSRKKHPKNTDTVTVEVDKTAVEALRELADLLETAFEIEAKY